MANAAFRAPSLRFATKTLTVPSVGDVLSLITPATVITPTTAISGA